MRVLSFIVKRSESNHLHSFISNHSFIPRIDRRQVIITSTSTPTPHLICQIGHRVTHHNTSYHITSIVLIHHNVIKYNNNKQINTVIIAM